MPPFVNSLSEYGGRKKEYMKYFTGILKNLLKGLEKSFDMWYNHSIILNGGIEQWHT